MELYVVVATSCNNCDAQGVGVFDHQPTEDEINAVDLSIGGMFCIQTNTYKVAINSTSEEQRLGGKENDL